MTRHFQRHVDIRADLPDGKVTGPLSYAFTSGDHVSVNTEGAHINDNNPAVNFRGESFLIHVHAYRHADGSWHFNREGEPDLGARGQHVTRRSNWSDAPPSFRDAIARAVLASIPAIATDAVLAQAEFNDAYNDESRALEEAEKLRQQFDEARKAVQAARRRREAAEARREVAVTEAIEEISR